MLLTSEARFTQFGCGLCAPPRWLNFDASPAMRLQRLPIIGFVKEWLAGNNHLWMYDYSSLSTELNKVGFHNIRRANFGDSGIEAFNDVENLERWTSELGVQCQK